MLDVAPYTCYHVLIMKEQWRIIYAYYYVEQELPAPRGCRRLVRV